MNVAAVGDDGGISLVLGLDVAAFVACVLIFLLIRYCCRSYSQMGFASRKQWAIEFHKHQNTPLLDKRHSQPPEEHDLHWYSWILKVFYKLQDTEIFSRCGPDAVLYLTLERYLIALLVIFSFLSVAVILPINYLQGDQLMAGFDRTTIANVDSKESLPGGQVEDIQIACDVSSLTKLYRKRVNAEHKQKAAQCAISELNKHPVVRKGWGNLLRWDKKYQVDAVTYYDNEVQAATLALDAERVHALEKGLGTSFVTFSSPTGASE
eukprot:Em0014g938a